MPSSEHRQTKLAGRVCTATCSNHDGKLLEVRRWYLQAQGKCAVFSHPYPLSGTWREHLEYQVQFGAPWEEIPTKWNEPRGGMCLGLEHLACKKSLEIWGALCYLLLCKEPLQIGWSQVVLRDTWQRMRDKNTSQENFDQI